MLCAIPRTDRTMPADVAIFQSSPTFDSWNKNMFEYQTTNSSINFPASRISRQRSVSSQKSSAKLMSQLEKATAGLLVSLSPSDKPTQVAKRQKPKKKLSFADDHGQPLFTEKVINEMPHEPPAIRCGKLDRLVERLKLTLPLDTSQQAQRPRKAFLIDFKQPMSDYIAFKENLTTNLVALENIVSRNRSILGTVKVQNVCFEKKVIVRFTFDGWRNSTDIDATHMKNAYEGDLQDTFKFTAQVPATYKPTNTIEFCVCFRTATSEHWDNNRGANYRMTCIDPSQLSPDSEQDLNGNNMVPELIAPSPSSIFY